MKISLNWLRKYISIKISPEKLAEKLTMAGLEVEKIAGAVGGDAIFELEITPNRPDCLNYLGIARELSAIFDQPLKIPTVKKILRPRKSLSITILDRQSCPLYTGALVEQIKIAVSSGEIESSLAVIGSRSINNVVDITNFCLLETGQPLHAFDYDRLRGGKIIVRRANKGERLITLDGEDRILDPSILVIADAQRPVAIAGIMGGKETEVTPSTKNILLESAWFDPIVIRRAARRLGLSSDSSYRFERGVDPQMVKPGAQRALSLIRETAGGNYSAYGEKNFLKKKSRAAVSVNVEEISRRLGANVSLRQARTILNRLGCSLAVSAASRKNTLKVSFPSWRQDLKEPVDLIEEIGRIAGYDSIPLSIPVVRNARFEENRKRRFKKNISQILTAQGFQETITYTLIDHKNLTKINPDSSQSVRIKNPLSQDQEILRPSLFPGILSVIRSNLNHGQKDIKIFEIGKEYTSQGESEKAAIAMTGVLNHEWRRNPQELNFYDLKGVVENLLGNPADVRFVARDYPFLEQGCACGIFRNERELGCAGRIAKQVLQQWDVKQKNVYFAQLSIDRLFEIFPHDERRYRPLPEYPAVVRDLSLAVKEDILFQQVLDLIRASAGERLTSIRLIEEYLGEKIPSGHRGLILSLTFQSGQRTLREEEVSQILEKIRQALVEQLGIIQR